MGLLEELRLATTDTHQRLHAAPALCRLTEPSVTFEYYKRVLERFYGFYQPLEKCYAASNAKELHKKFTPNMTIENLQKDINAHHINMTDLSMRDSFTFPFNLEQSLAYLYIREGSNLGGRVISKNLRDALNLIPGTDNNFFWGHGTKTGENWKLLLSTLEDFENKVDVRSVAKFAQDLFHDLEAWLHGGDN